MNRKDLQRENKKTKQIAWNDELRNYIYPMNFSKFVRIAMVEIAVLVISIAQLSAVESMNKSDLAAIDLFNGKNLDGWKYVSDANAPLTNTWAVQNGIIHCTGKPTGYLRTENFSFHDFKLTVEWRFVKLAPKADNTGVLVHIQEPDQVWPKCVQCQGRHGAQGDLFLMMGAESKEHRGQDKNTPLPKRAASNEKPIGEWNTCELICAGDSVKAFINGELMNEATECTVHSGAVGIQSEGAEIEIRKVVLEPLKPR